MHLEHSNITASEIAGKMVLTHSKHDDRPTAKNKTRLLKPAIGLKRPEKVTKVSTAKKINVVLTPEMTIALPTRSPWPILGTGPQRSGFYLRKRSPRA